MATNCLIFDENYISLLGISSMVEESFPDWRLYRRKSLCDAQKFLRDDLAPKVNLVIIGLSSDRDVQSIADFIQLAKRRSLRTLVISNLPDRLVADRLGRCGNNGYILKDDSVSNINRAITLVASGECDICSSFQEGVFPFGSQSEASRAIANMTRRQKDVVDLLLAGYSNKRIANYLKLSQGTIKNYVFDLMRLLNVTSRLELALTVREHGYRPSTMPMVSPGQPSQYLVTAS
ncbi:response regulator transcription factor [Microbulbifer litoralis]|uniref:response regulator transcription factor n=1 Tax=Microbulbifer litoralis TaxID=2933965 RepID=UPI002027BCE3|nr:response regulator transcription factor [Microbulbifer sp. GX H0434]